MGGGGQKSSKDDASARGATKSKGSKNNVIRKEKVATVAETLSFAFQKKDNSKILFFFGVVGAFGNGLVSLSSHWKTVIGFFYHVESLVVVPNHWRLLF